MFFDTFDAIRIINLPERRDRRAETLGQLRRVGLDRDPRVAFFSAIRASDPGYFSSRGERGCFESHLGVLTEAAARGQSLLILEDDVDFARGTQGFRMDGPLSIFYGGYMAADPDNLATSDIIGSHFMGFSAAVVQALVPYLSAIATDPDIASGRYRHPPIDGAYVWFRRANPNVATEFAVPQIGFQRPSRTDVSEHRWFDRMAGWRQASAFARRMKRLSRSWRQG